MIKPFRANKSGAHLASMSGGVETRGKKENAFLTSKSVGGPQNSSSGLGRRP